MKKLFFFFFLLFLPIVVSAGSIKELEILNGTLSRKFETDNNVYSVLLNEGESTLKLNYVLSEENAHVEITNNSYIEDQENQVTLEVESNNGQKEIYTFFLEKESVTPVFQETPPTIASVSVKMPHLEFYVGFGCFLIILILFKGIVIGFQKKK